MFVCWYRLAMFVCLCRLARWISRRTRIISWLIVDLRRRSDSRVDSTRRYRNSIHIYNDGMITSHCTDPTSTKLTKQRELVNPWSDEWCSGSRTLKFIISTDLNEREVFGIKLFSQCTCFHHDQRKILHSLYIHFPSSAWLIEISDFFCNYCVGIGNLELGYPRNTVSQSMKQWEDNLTLNTPY